MRRALAVAFVASTLSTYAHAADVDQKLTDRLTAATDVIHELARTPDRGVPRRIAARARCVAVVPGFKKGAFLVGAQYGQGVASCRTETGWSAPVFIQMTGASFGLQAGGQSTDLVLVGVSRHSVENLLKDKVKLGGDLAASAGPVGRNSQAATTVLANAEFLTYSRSRGLFAGVDLTGDVVNQNGDDTRAFYGKDVSYENVLRGTRPAPAAAQPFVTAVTRAFGRKVAQ